jgi:SAM-dependent methyltransferase
MKRVDMSTIRYNSIGKNYNTNRTADYRITEKIVELLHLPQGSRIADIGAGTGNYSNALAGLGYSMLAVEPSSVMLTQSTRSANVERIYGIAESLPLSSDSVDGVIVVLAAHHFSSLPAAAAEFHRVCPRGPFVIFTYEPRYGKKAWFYKYFPEIYNWELSVLAPVEYITAVLSSGNRVSAVYDFPLPPDLKDRYIHSSWNRPEILLDEQMRRNTSGFALADPASVRQGIANLTADLASGLWDARYGHLRHQEEFDIGFRFIHIDLTNR